MRSGCWVALACAMIMANLAWAQEEDSPEDQQNMIVESDFLWDVDGWTVKGDCDPIQHGQRMAKAADNGPGTWYFVAPKKFLGAKRAAYGGKLTFRHGFFEYNSEGRDLQSGPFDVVLISEANGLVVGKKNIVPAWAFRSDHELELVETAGWILNSTKGPPSRPDMIRLLSKLSAIWIRGGFYQGNEDSYIMNVKMFAGPVDATPKKSSLKRQRIHSGPSQVQQEPASESEVETTESRQYADEETKLHIDDKELEETYRRLKAQEATKARSKQDDDTQHSSDFPPPAEEDVPPPPVDDEASASGDEGSDAAESRDGNSESEETGDKAKREKKGMFGGFFSGNNDKEDL
eukprot:749204-Hanusia_phi.AAC.2